MQAHPVLQTNCLLLRAFFLADAAEVQRLAGDFAVADTTANIPHPYPDGGAEEWISSQQGHYEKGEQIVFAMELRATGQLVGAIALHKLGSMDEHGELGYWVGVPYWGQGYCSEAVAALLAYGFTTLKLNRIYAYHLKRNPASGRVMEKNGMQREGCLRQHMKRRGRFEDLEVRGILREEWLQRQGNENWNLS